MLSVEILRSASRRFLSADPDRTGASEKVPGEQRVSASPDRTLHRTFASRAARQPGAPPPRAGPRLGGLSSVRCEPKMDPRCFEYCQEGRTPKAQTSYDLEKLSAHATATDEKVEEQWFERHEKNGSIAKMAVYGDSDLPQRDVLLRGGAGKAVIVAAVRSGGVAHRSGVLPGDRLVSIDGDKGLLVLSAVELRERLQAPTQLIFLGFVGQSHAEVQLAASPRGCGLDSAETLLRGQKAPFNLCEERVFDTGVASIFFSTGEKPEREATPIFELRHSEARKVVKGALRPEPPTNADFTFSRMDAPAKETTETTTLTREPSTTIDWDGAEIMSDQPDSQSSKPRFSSGDGPTHWADVFAMDGLLLGEVASSLSWSGLDSDAESPRPRHPRQGSSREEASTRRGPGGPRANKEAPPWSFRSPGPKPGQRLMELASPGKEPCASEVDSTATSRNSPCPYPGSPRKLTSAFAADIESKEPVSPASRSQLSDGAQKDEPDSEPQPMGLGAPVLGEGDLSQRGPRDSFVPLPSPQEHWGPLGPKPSGQQIPASSPRTLV